MRRTTNYLVGSTSVAGRLDQEWVSWNHSITNTTATTIWPSWNERSAMVVSIKNSQTNWVSWNYQSAVANSIQIISGVRTVNIVQAPPLTPAQLTRAEHVEYNQQIERERAAAKDKAEKLLQSVLSPKQKFELNSNGFFHCRSRVGVLYRIYRGSHGNIRRLNDSGKEVERLCIQPNGVPEGDSMLAQKFHIENDEESFRRTANITVLN